VEGWLRGSPAKKSSVKMKQTVPTRAETGSKIASALWALFFTMDFKITASPKGFEKSFQCLIRFFGPVIPPPPTDSLSLSYSLRVAGSCPLAPPQTPQDRRPDKNP